MDRSLQRIPRVWRWTFGVALLGLYLIPGRVGFADALSIDSIVGSASNQGITVTKDVRKALNRLALIYDHRSDLQTNFGTGENINVRALLDWGIQQPDTEAQSLGALRKVYAEVAKEWDNPGETPAAAGAGIGVPTNGLPGLPPPS